MTILQTSPWRGFGASLRPSIFRDLARLVAARLAHSRRAITAHSRRAITARPDRRVAGALASSPIVFLSIDGRVGMVITTVDAWRGEPIGSKYDPFVDETGRFVGYYEPVTPANRLATA